VPNREMESDRTTLRRYLAIIQDPRGYPAESLEPAPPEGPEQPMLYTVVKADEHEAEVKKWRGLCEQVATHYSGSLDHQPAYVRAIVNAYYEWLESAPATDEKLNEGNPDGR
jgi:hypothetical protein